MRRADLRVRRDLPRHVRANPDHVHRQRRRDHGRSRQPAAIRALDPKTGLAFVQANFAGASCGGGVFQITFNAAAGTATATNLKCTLGPQTLTQTVVAQRQG